MTTKIRLGVSSCLLGEEVRYDGGHKRHVHVADVLAGQFTLVPLCPETECGMPVPRDPMRLAGDPAAPRLVVISSGEDVTEQMAGWIRQRLRQLDRERLGGFVLKSRSPSCGLEVDVYDDDGVPVATGAGLFARALMERMPVTDEASLDDPTSRERFLRRVLGATE